MENCSFYAGKRKVESRLIIAYLINKHNGIWRQTSESKITGRNNSDKMFFLLIQFFCFWFRFLVPDLILVNFGTVGCFSTN